MTLMQKLYANAGLPTDFGGVKRKAAQAWWDAELCALVRPKPEVDGVIEAPMPCGWCGCTEPLDTSYSDEGHGWPFCPQCKGV